MRKAPPIAAKGLVLVTALAAAGAVLASGSTFGSHDQWGWRLAAVWTFIIVARGCLDPPRDRSRVAALSTAAARLHLAQTSQEVTAIVLDQGRLALRADLLCQDAEPHDRALRAAVRSGATLSWLTPAPRRTRKHFTAADQQTLDLLACLASDNLARIALHAELETLATHDALTGLPNRASLHRALAAELAARCALPTATLVCDIDGFKNVNDRHGHEAGDHLLKVVADRIRACLRDGDVVSRLGGDQFVVLLPRTPRDEALLVAERVLAAVGRPAVLASGVAEVGVSLGVAVSSLASSADELLSQAGCAMVEAKALGKGRVRVWRPIQNAGVPEPRLGEPTRD